MQARRSRIFLQPKTAILMSKEGRPRGPRRRSSCRAVDGLDSERAGIDTYKGREGPPLGCQSTSNPRVYAAEDAAASPRQTCDSGGCLRKARTATQIAESKQIEADLHACPAWYSPFPNSARVSMLERKRARPAMLECHSRDYFGWFPQETLGETHAGAKIISGYRGQRSCAHMFGPDYAELINIFLCDQVGAHRRSNQDDAGGLFQRGHRIIGRCYRTRAIDCYSLLHAFPSQPCILFGS